MITSNDLSNFLRYNYQSWARIPAGPSHDACPRSFISSSRSAFSRAFSKLFFLRTKIRVPRVLAFKI